MTLPSSYYGDPLKHLLAIEGMTCKGCKYLSNAHLMFGIYSCLKKPKIASDKLRKCKYYDDKGK